MPIPIYVGYDQREAIAYSVFCHSVLSRTKAQVSFTPVTGEQRDGSNQFIYARFLVPYMQSYKGWAIWADGDMLCRADVEELWDLRQTGCDVMVVKHDYQTKHPVKYLGQRNDDYPRKNWSSLMLIDCGNAIWRKLTPEYVAQASGAHLHRFDFLEDYRIGELPKEWNWLVSEYEYNRDAKIAHFTIGLPTWYPRSDYSEEWRAELKAMTHFQPWQDTYDDTPTVSDR